MTQPVHHRPVASLLRLASRPQRCDERVKVFPPLRLQQRREHPITVDVSRDRAVICCWHAVHKNGCTSQKLRKIFGIQMLSSCTGGIIYSQRLHSSNHKGEPQYRFPAESGAELSCQSWYFNPYLEHRTIEIWTRTYCSGDKNYLQWQTASLGKIYFRFVIFFIINLVVGYCHPYVRE